MTASFEAKSGNPQNFKASLYADNGSGRPGSKIVDLSGSAPDTDTNHTYTCSGNSCNLSANTTYHLAFSADRGSNSTGDHFYRWYTTESNNQTSTPSNNGWSIANTMSWEESGFNWGFGNGNSGLLSVSAVKSPTLAAGSATATSLTLTIANHTGNWHYKHTTPSGGQCSSAVSTTTAIATGLNSGTSYTFKAYSDSSCTTVLATAAAVSTSAASLTASSIAQTTATLTISGHTAAWRYKYTKPTDGSCSNEVAAGTTSANLSGLAANTSYTFKAYSDSSCAAEITSDTTDADFLTKPGKPSKPTATVGAGSGTLTLASSSVTGNGALAHWLYSTDDSTWYTIPSTSATLSHIVTGLTNGTSYTFKVRAVNATGPGLASDASDSATPASATLTASAAAATSLKLTIANWSGDWYYKYTNPTGGTCSSTVSGATAIATGLNSNTSYTFKAYSDSSCSTVLATAAATSTLAAATLSATGMTHNSATLTIANYSGSWYYKYTSGSCSTTAVSGTTVSVSGLAGNTSYTFNAYIDSSCAMALTTPTTDAQFLTKPAKPTTPTVTTGVGSGNLIIISPLRGGRGALTRWEYTTDDGSTWIPITSDTDNLLVYTVTGLINGTSYTFKTRAVNATGEGPASDASSSVAPVEPRLTASGVTHNLATLTISNYTPDWYYKYTSPSSGGTCSSLVATATASLASLAGNTSYTYKAYSDSGCATELTSTSTDADFLTQPAQPGQPMVSAGVGSGKLTISSSISGGSGALSKWQYTTDDGTNWKDISTTSTTLSHTVTGLTDGTSYTFKVRAVNSTGSGVSGGGTGPESAASAATAPQTATLAANNVMATTATLAITDYSGNWYYKRTAPNPSAGTCVAVTGIGTPDARLSDLSPGTSYTFKAYSDNTCDTELTSDATDADFLTRPGQVSGVTVIASNRSLKVSWTAPSGTVTGYTVQWKSGSGEYDTTNQATSTGTSYTISGLTNDTQYTLRVAAKNTTGDGAWSDDATGTPDTNVTLTPSDVTDTSLKLTITNHSGTWYYKYISPDDPNNCTPVSSTTTVVTGLAANTSYTYTAYSDSGCSTELATATAVKTLLAQVTGVEVVPRDASLSVTWDRPRSGSPNYEVQWKSGNQDWDSANRQNTAQNYFTQIPSLSNAVEYTVRVRRITTSPSAVGEWSEPVKGTPAEVALTTRSVGATTATLVITNYANSAGDVWSYKRTAPTTAPARTA